MVHLPLVLTLISNSPRILISRQTIGIEIDNSITFRYATTPLFLLPLFPCYPVFYYLCPLCHYGFRSPVTMSFITSAPYVIMASASFCLSLLPLSIMSLWLPFPCYHVFYYFCPLCHYGFCIILSVIITSVHYVIMASVHSVCHLGFCPLCHYVFCSPVTLSFTYSVHYVFRSFCLV